MDTAFPASASLYNNNNNSNCNSNSAPRRQGDPTLSILEDVLDLLDELECDEFSNATTNVDPIDFYAFQQ